MFEVVSLDRPIDSLAGQAALGQTAEVVVDEGKKRFERTVIVPAPASRRSVTLCSGSALGTAAAPGSSFMDYFLLQRVDQYRKPSFPALFARFSASGREISPGTGPGVFLWGVE